VKYINNKNPANVASVITLNDNGAPEKKPKKTPKFLCMEIKSEATYFVI
jgi:hypothetical protein